MIKYDEMMMGKHIAGKVLLQFSSSKLFLKVAVFKLIPMWASVFANDVNQNELNRSRCCVIF